MVRVILEGNAFIGIGSSVNIQVEEVEALVAAGNVVH